MVRPPAADPARTNRVPVGIPAPATSRCSRSIRSQRPAALHPALSRHNHGGRRGQYLSGGRPVHGELGAPLKEGVQRLRTAILASNDTITEHIKWNAPSFRHAGQDRVTFRLQPGDKLQLLFHRGAKVRTDTAAFAFNDPTGLMTWLAPDRAVIDFPDLQAVTMHQAKVVSLVNRWVSS